MYENFIYYPPSQILSNYYLELLVSALIKLEEDGLFKVKGAWETAFVIYNHLCNLSEASLVLSIQMGEKGMVKLCSSNIVKYRGKMSLRVSEWFVTIETMQPLSNFHYIHTQAAQGIVYGMWWANSKYGIYTSCLKEGFPSIKSEILVTQ